MHGCAICGKKVDLPFKCKYCGLYYCDEHRLPEQHECTNLPPREWESKSNKQKQSSPSIPKKTTNCPKCGSDKTKITVVRKDYDLFLCLNCYNKWKEFHEPTKSELKIDKDYAEKIRSQNKIKGIPMITKSSKSSNKKWPIITIIIVVFLVVAGYYLIQNPNFLAEVTDSDSGNTTNPSTPNMPILTTPHVEVAYQEIGWFYGTKYNIAVEKNYNYTYLVLNLTITNHGYSQVNVMGINGFSVLVNDNEYTAWLVGSPTMYNGSTTSLGFQKGYYFDSEMPNQAILLDSGSVTGILVFELGDPNVYPQQPQILNEPYTLQYSVSYGDDYPLYVREVYDLGPYANVVVNKIG